MYLQAEQREWLLLFQNFTNSAVEFGGELNKQERIFPQLKESLASG
jgi:hypothetical protein